MHRVGCGRRHADEALPVTTIQQGILGVFVREIAVELLQNDDLDQRFGQLRSSSTFGLRRFTSSALGDHLRQYFSINQPAERI